MAAGGTIAELRRAVVWRLLAGFVLLAALFFGTAGTLKYPQAWVLLVVLFVPVTVVGFYLVARYPALVERRMRVAEPSARQRLLVAGMATATLVTLLVPGFDQRFGWSRVPVWLVAAADAGVLGGYLLTVRTLLANPYASRVVAVEEQQQLVTTGPYGWVRHPMYLGMTVMYLCMPLALGSWWGLLPAVVVVGLLVPRILDEERLLMGELAGYEAYCGEVRYRLIPGVW